MMEAMIIHWTSLEWRKRSLGSHLCIISYVPNRGKGHTVREGVLQSSGNIYFLWTFLSKTITLLVRTALGIKLRAHNQV